MAVLENNELLLFVNKTETEGLNFTRTQNTKFVEHTTGVENSQKLYWLLTF